MFAPLHARHPQRPKADNPRTKKRRCVQIVEAIAERIRKFGAGDDRRGVSAVDVITGKDRSVAQILPSGATKPARSVGPADPRDADTCSDLDFDVRRRSGYDADDL